MLFRSWQVTTFGTEWWDPSLVYLVREGDEIVAAEINALRFGMGWIGTLGTRRPWRGRGLGRALIRTAFAELYRRGQRRIGLAVDAGNETGARPISTRASACEWPGSPTSTKSAGNLKVCRASARSAPTARRTRRLR